MEQPPASPTDATTTPTPAQPEPPRIAAARQAFWKANLGLMSVLLVVWAIAGLGCGVLLADTLNFVRIGGFPLGFWFAQQGAIIVFVLVILVYAAVMNRLEQAHHEDLERAKQAARSDEVTPPDAHTPPDPGTDA